MDAWTTRPDASATRASAESMTSRVALRVAVAALLFVLDTPCSLLRAPALRHSLYMQRLYLEHNPLPWHQLLLTHRHTCILDHSSPTTPPFKLLPPCFPACLFGTSSSHLSGMPCLPPFVEVSCSLSIAAQEVFVVPPPRPSASLLRLAPHTTITVYSATSLTKLTTVCVGGPPIMIQRAPRLASTALVVRPAAVACVLIVSIQ